ncbi:MAG: DnaJ domain-containing protein [Alphaproteobacteria bacterium]|jgi:DnaJ like chaperone protein|nr:DnaJ domain-containing protein [Alphaproteobacteria bacterium]MBT4018922.1 DnaJ domain-containing protein [Alphaproteobacteria bacterium]MBT4966933.1 DnaJ domain-containing protein [Alphaproteobacteria bacterium]MBT5158160.1 DnaJ domain-containing protein [Alphaproteobacteria bacterium]MBT5919297.1 DnaJ domain-containing protein [Alphaproteobacteria bacterium]
MSIWGKIIGAAGGFAMGGPIGALIGGFAGHALDKMRGDEGGEGGDAGTRQIAFTIGVIALGAKMAKADGQVTTDEVAAFREVFHVPPEDLKNVARVFDQAKKGVAGFEAYAEQLAGLFQQNPAVLEDLLDGLFHIAKADNIYHPAEDEFLREVARIFGFSEHEFARIKEAHVGADKSDPYVILGVSRDVSDSELKSHYRKLIREHHPDTLIAQGMPQEFIDVANEKLAAINDAHDRIQRERDPK